MGAVETQVLLLKLIVDTLADESDDNYSAGDFSLREALDLVPFTVSKTITFDAALEGGTILLSHGQLDVDDAITIAGPSADLLTIDASGNDPTPSENNGDGSRVFNIPPGVNTGIVTISGLKLIGGDAGSDGGAVASYSGSLSLVNSTITGNSASGSGGGVSGDNLTVTNCTVSGNVALNRGGGLNGTNHHRCRQHNQR